jgi:hypothetical protein
MIRTFYCALAVQHAQYLDEGTGGGCRLRLVRGQGRRRGWGERSSSQAMRALLTPRYAG